MPRPRKFPCIKDIPLNSYNFIPHDILGENHIGTSKIYLNMSEIEAMRLRYYKNLKQADAAQKMEISQATFSRIITSAYEKITKALIEGKAINIQDGRPIQQRYGNNLNGGMGKGLGRGNNLRGGMGKGLGRGLGNTQSSPSSVPSKTNQDHLNPLVFNGKGCLNCGFEWEYDFEICPECKSNNIYRLIKKF